MYKSSKLFSYMYYTAMGQLMCGNVSFFHQQLVNVKFLHARWHWAIPQKLDKFFSLAAKHKNFRGQRSLLCVGFQNLIWFWHPLFVSRHTKQAYPISRRIMRQLVSYFRKITSERRAVNFIPTNPIITTAGTSIEHQREIQFIKWLRLHVYFKHALRRVDFGSW